jgi:NhaP-type Na+/H+ or K+/H+ antiporter
MSELFASGRIVDLILAFAAFEGALLAVWRRATGHDHAVADVATALLPGVCLLLALRCTMVGAAWIWTAAWLLAALVTHLVDLARRWFPAFRRVLAPESRPEG